MKESLASMLYEIFVGPSAAKREAYITESVTRCRDVRGGNSELQSLFN
jgi:hypothetical protein